MRFSIKSIQFTRSVESPYRNHSTCRARALNQYIIYQQNILAHRIDGEAFGLQFTRKRTWNSRSGTHSLGGPGGGGRGGNPGGGGRGGRPGGGGSGGEPEGGNSAGFGGGNGCRSTEFSSVF
jgi:hypothetical protein